MFSKFKNYCLLKKAISKSHSIAHRPVILDRKTILEGYNTLYPQANVSGSYVGTGTYIGSGSSLTNCKIGRFCSIAPQVVVVSGRHPISKFVSSSSSFYRTSSPQACHFFTNTEFQEIVCFQDGFSCHIGNDVWIGRGAQIKGGLTIGDGSVIAMGAVVVRDVPPYTIVGGCPAKPIERRFSDQQISDLLKICWWEWGMETLQKRANDFADIDSFIAKYKKK
jgi:acetyltransferase-like isoleucine patch superfamily enzyme